MAEDAMLLMKVLHIALKSGGPCLVELLSQLHAAVLLSKLSCPLSQECALSVKKINPRQYVAKISQIPGLEVWFQRASDVVRKLRSGDLDLGIVGTDMFLELADQDPDVIMLHDALNFGQCKLALGIPMAGKYANVNTLEQLRSMPDWTAETPLR
jgi:ATP phosphoribosyltransferase